MSYALILFLTFGIGGIFGLGVIYILEGLNLKGLKGGIKKMARSLLNKKKDDTPELPKANNPIPQPQQQATGQVQVISENQLINLKIDELTAEVKEFRAEFLKAVQDNE